MSKNLLKYFDVAFYVKFLIVFLGLYYFHLLYYGITTPTGLIYSSFLEHKLNYIVWTRGYILEVSNIILHVLGFPSHIVNHLTINVNNRAGVNLNYTCLGLGIMSFWIAFVVSHISNWKKKVYWSAAGILAISFINSCRVALLLISMEKHWPENKYVDHHDMFNYAAYIIIFLLIWLYNKTNNTEKVNISKLSIYPFEKSKIKLSSKQIKA